MYGSITKAKFVFASTQTNELARELNHAKREYEIKQEKITVTVKETSIKSETE